MMGCLSTIPCPTLGKAAAMGAISECNIEAKEIEEVYMGCVVQSGMGQAPARQVALGARCDIDTPSTTINKVCASGMKSAMMAAQAIALGERSVMMAGGMENMSRAPHLMSLRVPNVFGNATALDAINENLTDVYNKILMGACVEKICSEMGISREM
jgi:acetyl-CoA C-acetyltransferase